MHTMCKHWEVGYQVKIPRHTGDPAWGPDTLYGDEHHFYEALGMLGFALKVWINYKKTQVHPKGNLARFRREQLNSCLRNVPDR